MANVANHLDVGEGAEINRNVTGSGSFSGSKIQLDSSALPTGVPRPGDCVVASDQIIQAESVRNRRPVALKAIPIPLALKLVRLRHPSPNVHISRDHQFIPFQASSETPINYVPGRRQFLTETSDALENPRANGQAVSQERLGCMETLGLILVHLFGKLVKTGI
jgi:hypothetical protein